MDLQNETKQILSKHGIRPLERLDQNFIVDEHVLTRQVSYANLDGTEHVIEIGSGIGTLTKLLAEQARKVTTIEIDKRLLPLLQKQLAKYKNIEIICGDALKLNWPPFNKIVSNLPYSISSPLTFKLLTYDFTHAILTYQQEFAQRMVAQPGSKDYGRLTIGVQYRANASILENIPPSAFYPSPKVTSTLIQLVPHETPPLTPKNEEFFFNLTELLFRFRRKTIRKALLYGLPEILPLNKEAVYKVDKVLPEKTLNARAENLWPAELADLSDAIWLLFHGEKNLD